MMPESIVCEQTASIRLVPSITVDIHPTIETPPQIQKEKEVDTTQDDVEKALGLKITGGVDFKMPITIFHVGETNVFRLLSGKQIAVVVLFQVKDESKAKRVGLKLGDEIVKIEGNDTSGMTLKSANEALLHASHNIRSFKLEVIR